MSQACVLDAGSRRTLSIMDGDRPRDFDVLDSNRYKMLCIYRWMLSIYAWMHSVYAWMRSVYRWMRSVCVWMPCI